MKYKSGLAPIVIILIIVAVGGATYALVQRSVLKEYFQTGDKPTEQQFADTIDSSLNLSDDGMADLEVTAESNRKIEAEPIVPSEPTTQVKVLSQDKKEFTLDSATPVTFRWTPLVPKSDGAVTYRLKVWQLMQGQNSTEAMRSNKPIVTKDVDNITEATVSGIYTGPCRPPYLCEFIWDVQSMTKADTSIGTGLESGAQAEIKTGTN